MKSEFDSYAGGYEKALQPGLRLTGEDAAHFARERVRWLAGRLDTMRFQPRTVLDFGCGTGGSCPHLIQVLGLESYLGVDVSADSLAAAASAHQEFPTAFKPSADHRPGGDLDLAFCNGVFHHIPPAQRAEAVQLMADSLRPGGVLAFWENNPFNPFMRLAMRRVAFDRNAIMVWPGQARKLLQAAGLEVVRVDFLFIFPRFLKGLRFLEKWLCRIPLGAQYQILAVKPSSTD